MGNRRSIDADRAERLLDGTDSGSDRVARLLDAARASARPGEVRGEELALAAFRGASRTPLRPGRSRRLPVWANVLGVKAAVVGFTVLAAGVAVAAGTGVLPTPFAPGPVPPASSPSSATAGPAPSDVDRTSHPASSPSDGPQSPGPRPSPGASGVAVDHASLVGLCHAFRARGDREPGEAMGSAAFAALVQAAGGADRVEAFCAELLPTNAPSPTAGAENAKGTGGNGNGDPAGTHDAGGPAR